MTMKLVYHTAESMVGGTSPFDKVINQISKDDYINIACPYLSLSYLESITKNCKFWRLLTDVEAWLSSSKLNDRQPIQDFIEENSERVHHYKSLHAKVIFGGKKALIGSTNFTKKGITERIELGMFFDKEEQIEELQEWFDDLWQQTSSVEEKELSSYIKSLPEVEVRKPGFSLSSNAPKVKAKFLSSTFNGQLHGSENAHQRLVERIKLAPSREWIDDYFNLVQELLAFTGLGNDDPRLVLSIPQNKVLPVTINYRYVIAAFPIKEPLTAYIFGSECAHIPKLINKASYTGRFDSLKGETDSPPHYLKFNGFPSSIFSSEATDEVKECWRETVLAEMTRGTTSAFRKFHEPVVYEAAVNFEYRKKVLDEAFLTIV